MEQIEQVLEGLYSNLELRNTIVPIFMSNPGVGKTTIIENFFKKKNKKLLTFVISQRNPFEISGLAMPDKDIKKMSFWDFDSLLELKDGDGIFLDEFGNGNPIVANACLTFLESRTMISGKKLAKVLIVAAGNPQGMMMLTPQIKERFVWYNVKFDKNMWITYMKEKYQITTEIGNKLVNLINNESFTTENFHTPRSIDKAINMLINNIPTPYKEVISIILNTLVKNPFEEDFELPNGEIVAKDEMISWFKLIKLKNNTYDIITV